MIVSGMKRSGDVFEISFDHDGADAFVTIPYGSECWLELRRWGLADRIKRPTDIVGMEVSYTTVFGDDPSVNDQQKLAEVIVPDDMCSLIASYFDDACPSPYPDTNMSHHVHESDEDEDGDLVYAVWGCPYSLFEIWDTIAPRLKEQFPGKFWTAIRADKKDILKGFLKSLKEQRGCV